MAGRGDEPVEIQALAAGGRRIALAHHLTVVVDRDSVVLQPLADEVGTRHVQVALAAGPQPPATRAALKVLREAGGHYRRRLGQLDRASAGRDR
ncbi:MAG: hypothetical protein M3Q71_12765 [Chloroflexota bacterium]|nr:hypothetical protein [Chloroflexota bacterium]